MKKLFLVCSLVVALIGVMSFSAEATQISGAISFSGTAVPDNFNMNNATLFNSFSDAVVSSTGGTGDYAAVPADTPVTFAPFTFRPVFSPVTPLWTFDFGGVTYSFDADGLSTISSTSATLSLVGPGTAYIDGFDDTPGTWSFTANSAGSTASFSSSASTIPEPASMLLLGSGLFILGKIARRKFKK